MLLQILCRIKVWRLAGPRNVLPFEAHLCCLYIFLGHCHAETQPSFKLDCRGGVLRVTVCICLPPNMVKLAGADAKANAAHA